MDVVALTISWEIFQKTLSKTAQKVFLNMKEGMTKKGDWAPPEASSHSVNIPRWGSSSIGMSWESSLLEHRSTYSLVWTWKHSPGENQWWEQSGSLGQCFIITAVTPEFVEAHSLDISPLSDLNDSMLGINGFAGLFSWPLCYIIIRAQVEGVQSYDEDQVALVIPDSTTFGSSVAITLGTPSTNWIRNVIKESKIDELSASLNGLRIFCL